MNWTFRTLLGLTTLLCLIVVTFLSGQVLGLRREIRLLKGDMATKEDIVRVAVPSVTTFAEEKCTGCHTERRFAGEHSSRGEIDATLAHMQAMPDAAFSDEDMAKIHASLRLLRCTRCHGEDQLRLLALRTPEQRMDVIRRMVMKPESGLSPDDIESINQAYQQLLGF